MIDAYIILMYVLLVLASVVGALNDEDNDNSIQRRPHDRIRPHAGRQSQHDMHLRSGGAVAAQGCRKRREWR